MTTETPVKLQVSPLGRPYTMTKRKTIALDFDGVVHRYGQGWHDGTAYDKPMDGFEDAFRYLMRDYNVFILSTRDAKTIQDWFAERFPNVQTEIIPNDTKRIFWDKEGVLGITNKKLSAMAYIDDRAVRFTNWKDIKNKY